MKCIGWDVSAGDWATDDGELVAKRVLEKVKPGSIILLHDGLEGDLTSDRSVVVTALPIILRELEVRSYDVLRLDELLKSPGYLP